MPRLSRRKFLQNAALSSAALSQAPHALAAAAQRPTAAAADAFSRYKLHYNHPAPTWPDALPVGNGRLGAMVFGNPALERIQLNEESIWDGERRDRDNPHAATAVPRIRELLFAGKVHEAEALALSDMMSIPRRMPCYQTLGDLHLDFAASGLTSETQVENYRLELDLDRAICTTTFTHAGITYTREVFSSAPDQAIIIRLTASKPNSLSFTATLDRPGPAPIQVAAPTSQSLTLDGEALPVNDNPNLPIKERQIGIRFHAELRVLTEDKRATISSPTPTTLQVANATSVTLLLDCATSFRHPAASGPNPENTGDPAAMRAAVSRNLAAAAKRPYAHLLARHVADHQSFFRRADVSLTAADPNHNTPTDQRLAAVKSGAEDPGLIQLHFQYGRYLLIGSSRPGTLAANLQGIWNESVDPPWGSKYTININAQMNYWLAERTSLGDLHFPLFDLLDATVPAGRRIAQSYYKSPGFVVHHNTDIWGDAGPIDALGGGIWPTGAAWLATHLYEHFEHTGDLAFLRTRCYPVLRDISLFFLSYLTPTPDGQHLVTGPSCSPENAYRLPDGSRANLCMGPTMDNAIVRAVFDLTTQSAKLLNTDADLLPKIAAARAKLPPYKTGSHGQLQEWPEDYAEVEPGHRHISHLWGLYPGDQITPDTTPDLARAARISLDRRLAAGSGSTGWSRAWIINCLARLRDGDAALHHYTELLRTETRPNLFDVCGMKPNSPYQIDGNLGAPAALAEILLQSHNGIVRLLPALPSAWPEGSFHGLHARGNLTISCRWSQGKATEATLHAASTGTIRLALPPGRTKVDVLSPSARSLPESLTYNIAELPLTAGGTYHLLFS